MPRVQYDATAEELVGLYREYDWWADRDAEVVRDALRDTDEVVTLREPVPAPDTADASVPDDSDTAEDADTLDQPDGGDGPDTDASDRTDTADDRDTDTLDQTDTDSRDTGASRVVAAARVLTDYTYYATVYDVIVRVDRRGEGLGRQLLTAVRDHPRLTDVTPMLLAREGLVPFYESCGFEPVGPVEHPDGDPEPLEVLMAEGAREE